MQRFFIFCCENAVFFYFLLRKCSVFLFSAAEMQRFFIFCEKMYDLGRFGTIWNDFVRFGTIWYD